MKCKSVSETRSRVVTLINLCTELCDNASKLVPENENTFAVWLLIDDDSKMKAESKGMTEGKTEFSCVCDHLEALGNDKQNKQATAAYAKIQIVKMDLSTVGPKAPDSAAAQLQTPGPEAEAEKESLDAFSGKCHKCEGVGHRQADRQTARQRKASAWRVTFVVGGGIMQMIVQAKKVPKESKEKDMMAKENVIGATEGKEIGANEEKVLTGNREQSKERAKGKARREARAHMRFLMDMSRIGGVNNNNGQEEIGMDLIY